MSTLRGRRALAFVASTDAAATTAAALLFVAALDNAQFIDLALFAAHLTHLVTAPLVYFVVRYVHTHPDVLRAVMVFYTLALVLDTLALAARLVAIAHSNTPCSEAARALIASAFVLIDANGAFFANLSQQYALSEALGDAQLLELGVVLAQQNGGVDDMCVAEDGRQSPKAFSADKK